MNTTKPHIIKDFNKLDKEKQEQIKLEYPNGFSSNLISFTNKHGILMSALPFETKDKFYLFRMTIGEADKIIRNDDDYGEDGILRKNIKNRYEIKYADLGYAAETIADDSSDDDDD
ncbi:MAG: hypothetical protein PF517_05765 [Salinivirgaceae bacterium]|jgi:hypothetical protein|nr:hypothetical protein [Salinivirgaceae bacterium]